MPEVHERGFGQPSPAVGTGPMPGLRRVLTTVAGVAVVGPSWGYPLDTHEPGRVLWFRVLPGQRRVLARVPGGMRT